MKDNIIEIGSKGGMALRTGQVTEVGCTERIRKLNGLMHASRPNLEMQRTRVFTKYFKEHESESQIRKILCTCVVMTRPCGILGGKIRKLIPVIHSEIIILEHKIAEHINLIIPLDEIIPIPD